MTAVWAGFAIVILDQDGSSRSTALVAAFNAWHRNDLDLPPAAVTETGVRSLPSTPRELIALLPEAHRSFVSDACGPTYETLSFSAPQSTDGFDPAADILPAASDSPAGKRAQAEAKRYFEGRCVSHLEVTGNDSGHELFIALRIAHDREAGLLFSLLQVSD